MKIDHIISQNRRDFQAIYVCEHCSATVQEYGYDDEYFHTQVIPRMKCKNCGKVSSENYRPLSTKYPEGQIV